MIKRAIALLEILLVAPAALFMVSLFVRNLQPTQYEPAHSAKLIVDWFAARRVLGLDVFLFSLPLAALLIGCAVVWYSWRSDAEVWKTALATIRSQTSALVITGTTLIAGAILAIVAFHTMVN
jgi:hypothetical protein